MTALGRILQVIGWLWIAVGFFGPLVNIPDVSVFPGIIILFVSRVIRKQGEQAQRQDEDVEQAQEQQTPRPLNTERSQPPVPRPKRTAEPAKSPQPEREPEPRATPAPRVTSTERPRMRPSPDLEVAASATPKPAGDDEERTEMLESVLLAGKSTTEKSRAPVYPETKSQEKQERPLTSAEMIARAHRRWDRKPT